MTERHSLPCLPTPTAAFRLSVYSGRPASASASAGLPPTAEPTSPMGLLRPNACSRFHPGWHVCPRWTLPPLTVREPSRQHVLRKPFRMCPGTADRPCAKLAVSVSLAGAPRLTGDQQVRSKASKASAGPPGPCLLLPRLPSSFPPAGRSRAVLRGCPRAPSCHSHSPGGSGEGASERDLRRWPCDRSGSSCTALPWTSRLLTASGPAPGSMLFGGQRNGLIELLGPRSVCKSTLGRVTS